MFNIRKLFILLSAVMLALLTSCEFGSLEKRQETGSAVFDFSAVTSRLASASRTVTDFKEFVYEEVDTFADLKLEGDFEYFQKINLKETQTLQIDNIPVGSKITASIEIYMEFMLENEGRNFKETMWHGTSDQYEIKDGPNEIIIPLIRGGNEEIIDEPEEEEDPKITIYVKYDETKPASFWNDTSNKSNENSENDGKSLNTAFNYIQSAINWIAENGDGDEDYEIMLTGYDETHAFDQDVYATPLDAQNPYQATVIFGKMDAIADNLNGKANSITLTSDKPEIVAIKASHGIDNILIRTRVPLYFKNIRIATESRNRILDIEYNIDANVFLKSGTVFSDNSTQEERGSSAIWMEGGTVTMQDNAIIENFYSSDGGAVYLKYGTFKMKDNSRIQNCKASSQGGAIYMYNSSDHSPLCTLSGGTIYKCSSPEGGAIYQYGGSMTIEGGSIIECKASNEGGAIKMDASSKNITFYLKGGIIKDNEAPKGSAIFMTNGINGSRPASLIMSDDACVDLSNDIYSEGFAIKLGSSLATTEEKAARITFSSSSFIDNSALTTSGGASEEDIKNNCTKFYVSIANEDTDCYINQNGILKQLNLLTPSDYVTPGDIVFADNQRVRAEDYPNLSQKRLESIAGVVFFVGGTDEDSILRNTNLIAGTTVYNDYFESRAYAADTTGYDIFDVTEITTFPRNGSDYNTNGKLSVADLNETDFSGVYSGNNGISNVMSTAENPSFIQTFGDLYGGDRHPLYDAVLCYGKNFQGSTRYGVNDSDESANWYIPTIAEYYFFAKALENVDFKNIYLKLCSMDFDGDYMSETVVQNGGTPAVYLDSDEKKYLYNFIINFKTNEISCATTPEAGNNTYNAIPIHIYNPEN